MEKLVIITNNYPYGHGEEFFETEIEYLSKEFNHIDILSLSERQEKTRILPINVFSKRVDVRLNILEKIMSLKFITNREFIEEIKILRKKYKRRISLSILKSMLSYIAVSIKLRQEISVILGSQSNAKTVYLYSYWMHYGAYTVAKYKDANINKNIISFCRCHGYDLYFERNNNNYLPFRNYIANKLDMVFPISVNGKKYLERKLCKNNNNIIVARLGIINEHNNTTDSKTADFNIVSCSSISNIKRLNLVVEALSLIDDIQITWTHIGDGDSMHEIKNLANKLLCNKNNITFIFKGYLNNNDVYSYYRKHNVDIFINVSKSEGIPVSMMEAFSFGIPIISTNVGGVREIVNYKNGILLCENPSINDIVSSIRQFKYMSKKKMQAYRINAYLTWKELYNAENNYPWFIKKIKNVTE